MISRQSIVIDSSVTSCVVSHSAKKKKTIQMPPARLSIGGGTNGWLGASAGDFENNNSGRTTPYFKCIVVAMLSESESAHAKP